MPAFHIYPCKPTAICIQILEHPAVHNLLYPVVYTGCEAGIHYGQVLVWQGNVDYHIRIKAFNKLHYLICIISVNLAVLIFVLPPSIYVSMLHIFLPFCWLSIFPQILPDSGSICEQQHLQLHRSYYYSSHTSASTIYTALF